MTSPLNPTLYAGLKKEFGTVAVSNPGAAADKAYEKEIYGNRIKLRLTSAGEYYPVCCPYCGDGRKRLWVNHLWGVQDEMTGGANLHLAYCYNEKCLEMPGRPMELYDRIYGFKNAGMRGRKVEILQGEIEEHSLKEVQPPGLLIPIDKVPTHDPASQFLTARGYDLSELVRLYDVSLCVDARSEYPAAQGRIVMPIRMNDMLVGWQCRYPKDLDFKTARVPKYYNRPNMPRRLMLYNYDNARQYPFVVVCEGPTDVWNTGPYGVAAFGKHLAADQVKLICKTWSGGAVVILLDGDAWNDSLELAERFSAERYNGAVIPVQLPADKDPGALDRALLADAIVTAAEQQGVDLTRLELTNDTAKPIPAGYRCRIDGPRRKMDTDGLPDYSFDKPGNAGARA